MTASWEILPVFLLRPGRDSVSRGQRSLRIFDSGLDVLLPVEMRNRRCRGSVVDGQRILWAVKALQAQSGCAQLGSQRLPLGGISLGEVLILGEGAFKVLHFLRALAQLEPGHGRQLAS